MLSKEDFELLFNDCYNGLYAYAFRYLQSRDAAEDIVQEVFCLLWNNRKTVDIQFSAKSYLYTSVKNKCLNLLKHNDVHHRYEQIMLNEGEVSENFSAEEFNQSYLEEFVFNAINQLPSDVRDIFVLNKLEGVTAKQIAEKTGVSFRTIEGQLARAMKLLKESADRLTYSLVVIYLLLIK